MEKIMPLSQTKVLANAYGRKLQEGSISDAEIDYLLKPDTFKKSEGFVDPSKPLSDSNFSKMDSIKDFVLTIAPTIPQDKLHDLTARLIARSPEGEKNTFMRGSSLEKAFLAYELLHYPTTAETHFDSERVKKEFPGTNDIPNLREVILKPIIEFYRAAPPPAKLQALIKYCSDYKSHLESSVGIDNLNQSYGVPTLAQAKYQIVNQMLDRLSDKVSNSDVRIKNMTDVLTPQNRETLKSRRDSSAGARFLENILHVLTLTLYSLFSKGTASFWKSHGEVLTDAIDKENEADNSIK
jgi:VPS inhibitor protein E